MKKEIEFKEFLKIKEKLEIKLGIICEAVRLEKSNKMLKLTVDFGTEERTVLTNIGNRCTNGDVDIDLRRDLIGQSFPFITNLKPATIMGIESSAMILVAEDLNGPLDLSQSLPGSTLL